MLTKNRMKTNRRRHRVFAVFLALALVFTVAPASVSAAEEQTDNCLFVQSEATAEIIPAAADNLVSGLRETSSLTVTSDGYMRVYYSGGQVGVEYYDSGFNIISGTTIAMELSTWGGFYAGSDAYYLVEGQNNTDEDDNAEVIRVIKYSLDWQRLGAANITGNSDFGGDVRYPFNYGCVQFAEYNGTLYIVTGHQGYVDESVGQGHQGFLMIAVDESEMTGQIVKSDLYHSLAQYIESDESDLYVLEQSEGARCTALSKIDADTLNTTKISVLSYGGTRTSTRAINCYASVDGMALSSDNVLCVGTSIDQSQYDSVTSDTSHNIYLTVTPKSDFTEDTTSVKWLTDFSGDGKCFVGLKITKVNDERFMISWEEYTGGIAEATDSNDSLSGWTLHYVFVDGGGNTVSSEFTAAAPVSECQPVLNGSDIVYYASSSNMVDFYKINAYSGEFSKKIYRIAGESATWDITDGVLTISGSGTVSVDPTIYYRYPVSSCLSVYSYSDADNAWKPVSSSVEEIIIESGITEISDGSFKAFPNMAEVSIQTGVETIGDEAFAYCNSLRKITIPASVVSIGDDILWTGYYWTYDQSHVVQATIYCEEGSAAESYAKENKISYVLVELDDGSSSGAGDTLMVRRGNTCYFNYTLKGGNADFSITAGRTDDTVLVGDWDGDGIDSICLRRGNTCYFVDDITTMNVYLTVTYGRASDEVLVGDWDGDGCDSLAMRRNGNIYYFCNDITAPDADTWSASYGRAADEVIVGDWEDKGYDSLAVRRNGNVYYFSLSKVTDPDGDVWKTTFGRAGDEVLVGDWDADGTDTLAMRRSGNTYFISNSIASPDSGVDRFTFGRASDTVYAGKWK